MVVLYLVRVIFLLTLAALVSSKRDDCTVRRCSYDGPEIRFPFRLREDQPQHCGFPGFDLSCQNQETVLENPFSVKASDKAEQLFPVKFVISQIDYKSQLLNVSRVDGCLQGLLHTLNLSASPFYITDPYGVDYDNYSFFNCSSKRSWDSFDGIPCLSSSSYQVSARFSGSRILYETLVSCTKMYEVHSIPINLLRIRYPLVLNWFAPTCGYCVGKFCRLQNNSSLRDIECLNKTDLRKKVMIAGAVLGAFLIVFIAIGSYKICRRKKLKKEDQLKIAQFLEDYKALKPTRYSYADIKKITGNLSEKLGQGGYGIVYKGKLSNEVSVAVKVLNSTKGDGEDFINEVGTIGRIHHVNVVRLVGYCADGIRRVLVYEFLPNHSLEEFRPSEKGRKFLGWEKLQNVALGIAKGIEYLHQGCEQQILHFDIKPHNILLDQNFNPKISDFGQAKLCSKEQSAVSMTAARGTMGYIAPEVFSRNFGKVSGKSDIYSFGMLLLEMVGGRKSFANNGGQDKSEIYFPEWIYNKLDQREEIAIQIENEDDKVIARKLMIIALWCIQWYPVDRPSIKVVIQMVEAEEVPSMPRNPFGSTNKIQKQRATASGGIYSSELQSISELEE